MIMMKIPGRILKCPVKTSNDNDNDDVDDDDDDNVDVDDDDEHVGGHPSPGYYRVPRV